MPDKFRVCTTETQFNKLHYLAHSRATTVKVDRQTLMNLLMDHTRALAALTDKNVRIEVPPEARIRPRLNP